MKKWKTVTKSTAETINIARKLGELVKSGDVIALEGDLGAGKTTFTKGLAEGLGVKRVVNSPTFTIIKEYEGRIPLYHMDVYRLEFSDEDIGFDEYFYGQGVTVVEWATFIEEFLPSKRLNISIETESESSRRIICESNDEHYDKIINQLKTNY